MLISLLFTAPSLFMAIFIALVIAITVHEFSHVLTARWLGDRTGEYAGRLTLNPMKHLDPWGTVAILLIGFGWGRPAPFNKYNLRAQRFGPAIVALGGPISNFIMMVVFGIALKLLYPVLGPANFLIIFLTIFVTFNGVLMIFNLIPVPPLDGSHLLEGLLGPKYAYITEWLNRYGPRVLFGLIFISIFLNINIFGFIIEPFLNLISKVLGIELIF